MRNTYCIIIFNKSGETIALGCGYCFAQVEEADGFCWQCGLKIDTKKPIGNLTELIEQNSDLNT
jgi:predicted amidophosphoribosyltransferase